MRIKEKITMNKRKTYTEEFKRDVLEMASQPEVSIAQLERDLGITKGLIYKWRERYRVDEESGGLKPSEERAAAAEIRRLQRELAVARQERDILKKAIQVFSQDHRL
jgi:transposase